MLLSPEFDIAASRCRVFLKCPNTREVGERPVSYMSPARKGLVHLITERKQAYVIGQVCFLVRPLGIVNEISNSNIPFDLLFDLVPKTTPTTTPTMIKIANAHIGIINFFLRYQGRLINKRKTKLIILRNRIEANLLLYFWIDMRS